MVYPEVPGAQTSIRLKQKLAEFDAAAGRGMSGTVTPLFDPAIAAPTLVKGPLGPLGLTWTWVYWIMAADEYWYHLTASCVQPTVEPQN